MNRWLALILVVLVAGSWWYFRQQETLPTGAHQVVRGPQSFIRQARLLVYDDNGVPGYRVEAEQITHHSETGTVLFTRPRLAVLRDDTPGWLASADAGSSDDAGEEFLLTGNVTIRRAPDGDRAGLQVTTDELHVRPDDKSAETTHAAVISSQRYRVESTGFRADLERNELQLHSYVRGWFDAQG